MLPWGWTGRAAEAGLAGAWGHFAQSSPLLSPAENHFHLSWCLQMGRPVPSSLLVLLFLLTPGLQGEDKPEARGSNCAPEVASSFPVAPSGCPLLLLFRKLKRPKEVVHECELSQVSSHPSRCGQHLGPLLLFLAAQLTGGGGGATLVLLMPSSCFFGTVTRSP
jgi:hypothetical protein